MKVLDFVTRNTNWTLSFLGVSAHDVNKKNPRQVHYQSHHFDQAYTCEPTYCDMVDYFIIFGKSLNCIELLLLSGIAWGY